MRYKGKIVFITGGSKGIGRGLVRGFAKEEATVHFTYKNHSENIDIILQEAEYNHWNVYPHMVDSANPNEIAIQISAIDHIDVFINNAEVVSNEFISLMSVEQWKHVVDVNLNGCFYYLNRVSKKMVMRHDGVIINIASVAGLRGRERCGNYSASEAGIISLTQTLSLELASKNVRVNAIAPGYIQTENLDQLSVETKNQYLQRIPLNHFGSIDDIVNTALFLASEQATYITGQCICVDGGVCV